MNGITVQLVFAMVGTRVPYHLPEPPAAAKANPTSRSPVMGGSFSASLSTATASATRASSSPRAESASSTPNLSPSMAPETYTTQYLLTLLGKVMKTCQASEMVPPAPQTPSNPLADHEHRQQPHYRDASNASSEPPSPGSPRSPTAHEPPLMELFHYDTLDPLDGTVALLDEDVLIVLCDQQTSVQLVEALQLRWLETYSGAHRPHRHTHHLPSLSTGAAGDMEMAVCTTEERVRNVARAREALCKPVALHLQLLTAELTRCQDTLGEQVKEMRTLRSSLFGSPHPAGTAQTPPASAAPGREGGGGGSSHLHHTTLPVTERFPLLAEIEPTLSEVLSSDSDTLHSASCDASLLLCETRLRGVETLLPRIAKQYDRVAQLAAEEAKEEQAFAAGPHAQAYHEFLSGTEQDRNAAETIVQSLQVELVRQLGRVRFLVAHITLLRNRLRKTLREMGAIGLIVSRFYMTVQRPRLLEEAEALLRRRVVLRRAARRQLLLLQETEFVDLQTDVQTFIHRPEVHKMLPQKVRWYLHASMPILYPPEDSVATLLDHALIDRDEDEAQELVEKTRFVEPHETATTTTNTPAEHVQELNDALLPLARLMKRTTAAEARAAAYEARVEELEKKLKAYEEKASTTPPAMVEPSKTAVLQEDTTEERA